jgi:hypothetical protein
MLATLTAGYSIAVSLEDDTMVRYMLEYGIELSKSVICMDHFCPTSSNMIDTLYVVSDGARRILTEPNAGGNSYVSEILSAEYMVVRFNAYNFKTEMEIVYIDAHWKKVDYLCMIFDQQIGVSVTRAMGYPYEYLFTYESAVYLLNKKLNGLIVARAGLTEGYHYNKSILHVWCQSLRIALLVDEVFKTMRNIYMEDVIIITTITDVRYIYRDDKSVIQ